MSYKQLRKLNDVWKKDYAAQIIKESDQMQHYIEDSIKKARFGQEEVGEMIDDLDEVTDTWQDALNDIQKKIIEKAIEYGLTKEDMEGYTDE